MCCRKLLYKDCLDWMKSVTNMSLDENAIDMSCAKYTNTGKKYYNIYKIFKKIFYFKQDPLTFHCNGTVHNDTGWCAI